MIAWYVKYIYIYTYILFINQAPWGPIEPIMASVASTGSNKVEMTAALVMGWAKVLSYSQADEGTTQMDTSPKFHVFAPEKMVGLEDETILSYLVKW